MATTQTANLYDVLHERGLVAQTTDENIRQRFERPVTAYIGFDATADSLHIGSLLPIMTLAHLQRCGHRPIVVIGGATTLVGDPSGKDEARKMLGREQIDANARAIAKQIAAIVDFNDSPTGAVLVNNADWLQDLNWIELLRTYGPAFSVNRMLTMDSVRSRLDTDGAGLSFLEFNYMVMQAIDFLHLHRAHGCTVQLGGQDQWGNIVMGIELARRLDGADLAGLTFPLVTKTDGGKFGKTEAGNIWLDPNRTSPYAFYQFWRNTADADVGRYLGYFTFLPMDRVNDLATLEAEAINEAKEMLAYEVTKLVHGEAEAQNARDSARKAFREADVTGKSIPHETIRADELGDLRAMMVRAGLAKSNGEAKKLIQAGGVRLGDQPVTDITHTVTADQITDDYILIRVGKKRLFRFDVQP